MGATGIPKAHRQVDRRMKPVVASISAASMLTSSTRDAGGPLRSSEIRRWRGEGIPRVSGPVEPVWTGRQEQHVGTRIGQIVEDLHAGTVRPLTHVGMAHVVDN